MNKIKVTKKQIENSYCDKICVGYCDLWYLLQGLEPKYYTCGIYGWNADIYEIDYNTVIITGYRPFGNIVSNEKGINKKYNEKAREICNNEKDYKTMIKKINKLLEKYIKEVKTC